MHGTDSNNGGEGRAVLPAVEHGADIASAQACPLPFQVDPVAFQKGMQVIRFRRRLFFCVVILYMPIMWGAHKISPTFNNMAITFSIWVAVLFTTALYSALARCPRCGNYFHMNGMSLLYLRRCLHCQHHITHNC